MADNWQRLFAYLTGSLVFGLLVIIFTHNFFNYVNRPGWMGYTALFGYGLVYLNFAYIINRRFTQKQNQPSNAGYVMAVLLILPTLAWIFTKETGLAESLSVFTLTVIFAAFLGTYYGIRSGIRRRSEYLQKTREQGDSELPDDLHRPHDDLKKN